MKKIGTSLFKFLAGIWCIAFAIFFLSFLLKTQDIIIPFLENYRQIFESLLDNFFSNWFLNLCFGIGFVVFFLWGLSKSNKDMGWDNLAKKYSYPRDKIKNLNLKFDYGQSYFNDVYYNGLHLSSIPKGLILRHPFPFNYLRPALLIPWDDISSIKIERGLKPAGQNKMFYKIGAIFSFPWKYANVKLSFYKNIGIVIPWKPKVKEHVPNALIIKWCCIKKIYNPSLDGSASSSAAFFKLLAQPVSSTVKPQKWNQCIEIP